jgi:hypothetical protein
MNLLTFVAGVGALIVIGCAFSAAGLALNWWERRGPFVLRRRDHILRLRPLSQRRRASR